jgi:uncharacterized membrane protein (UPF0127 family)
MPLRLPLMLSWLALSCLIGAGCHDRSTPTPSLAQTVTMKLGDRNFNLEIAATERARQFGLMERTSMPKDHGMIFVFSTEAERGFHMKRTLIPLDIVYVNGQGKVMSIARMPAEAKGPNGDWKAFPSGFPIKYAIELNAGMAAEAGIHVGDVLQIPSEVRAPGNLE